MKSILSAAIACLAILTLGPSAHADGRNPGSLIVYPEYRFGGGFDTIFTVTNTHPTLGTVVHINYVSGETNTLCNVRDSQVTLLPNDTFTALVSAHNAGGPAKGYIYVYAQGAPGATSFNFLVGDLLIMEGTTGTAYSIEPLPFTSPKAIGLGTDMDMDNIRDLNDVEYEKAPARVLIPRFMGQAAGVYQSDLILLGLSGGRRFTTIVDFLVFNDNEEIFSAQYAFQCWEKSPLTDVNGIFTRSFLQMSTNDDVDEVQGAPAQETGFIWIDGNVAYSTSTDIPDPAVIAVLIEKTSASKIGAELPFFDGVQLGGDLLPTGNSWDGD